MDLIGQVTERIHCFAEVYTAVVAEWALQVDHRLESQVLAGPDLVEWARVASAGLEGVIAVVHDQLEVAVYVAAERDVGEVFVQIDIEVMTLVA